MGAKATKEKKDGQAKQAVVADASSALAELVIHHPAPTASPPSAPADGYRIVKSR